MAEKLDQFAGRWVALDRFSGEVVVDSNSPARLSAQIRQLGLTEIAIMRAPHPDNPELVGLG